MRSVLRTRLPALLAVSLLASAAAACSSDDGTTSTAKTDTSSDTSADSAGDSSGIAADTTGDASADTSGSGSDTADNGSTEDIVAGPNDLLTDGDWFLGVQAAPFGDLKLPFKVKLIAEGNLKSGGKILSFEMRALTASGDTTAVIATAKNIGVNPGGSFAVEFAKFVLPAVAAPTGSDVPMTLKLSGSITAKDSFCGDVEGSVPDFSADLKGSKFKAVLFGKQGNPFESACSGDAKIYTGIDKCPVLLAGDNTVTSAERTRQFQVFLPKDVTDPTGLPLVLLFHGVGGEPGTMVEDSGLLAEQAKKPFVLVAPRSERGSNGKALLKTDWYYGKTAFDMDNPDLVFFDDVVKCAAGQFKTDAKRVYVTGMSGGGLISAFIGVNRPKVVAAAAPFSGGYLHALPAVAGKVPFVVSWGGPNDTAYEQNFDAMAKKLTADLLAAGHLVIACDHGLKHIWPKEGGAYAAAFLLGHKLGEASPFATAGLGAEWPSYCKLLK